MKVDVFVQGTCSVIVMEDTTYMRMLLANDNIPGWYIIDCNAWLVIQDYDDIEELEQSYIERGK